MPHAEIVDTVPASRAAVAKLEREEFVAVDTEGVNLSKTGPITLVQIGTARGHVYLFDVMREPRMFKDGGLKRFLEEGPVVKVLHSAKNDADALHAQHGVTLLHNVHDIQLAHMEFQRKEGAKFPMRAKLEEVLEVYCPEKVALLKAEKDNVQSQWNKFKGEYWAERPLTQEMIEYAANDVLALIPEVYLKQKKLLEEKRLTRAFKIRVEEDIKRTYDQSVREKLEKEEKERVHSVILDFAATANRRTRFEDIEDENVISALISLRLDDMTSLDLPPFFPNLKFQQINSRMDDIEEELKLKGRDFDPNGTTCRALHFFSTLKDNPAIKARAERLMKEVQRVLLEDIKNKYTTSTPARHLAAHEKNFLSHNLRPKGVRDPSFHRVVLSLYWKVKEEDLDENIARFQADPSKFQVSDGYAKVLRFYLSGDVPSTLKAKAKDFLSILEAKGKVTRPQKRQERRAFGGRYRRSEYDCDDFNYDYY